MTGEWRSSQQNHRIVSISVYRNSRRSRPEEVGERGSMEPTELIDWKEITHTYRKLVYSLYIYIDPLQQ